MELYTYKLNPNTASLPGTFEIQNVIENFESLIWTERYYGDSEVQIITPIDVDLIAKLPMGIFLGIEDSNELLILETVNIEDGRLKFQGISILSWLNSRFVRTSNKHKAQSWIVKGFPPGRILWEMLNNAIGVFSEYLDASVIDIGIPQEYLHKFKIPEIGLFDYDVSDPVVKLAIPFNNLYDEMRNIAVTYQIGMQIFFAAKTNPDSETPLAFRSYKGLNKTHAQNPGDPQNPIVRFSEDLNSLENVRELKSQTAYKTISFAFASALDTELSTIDGTLPGIAYLPGTEDPDQFRGFDCRAVQTFAEDLTGYDSLTSADVDDIDDIENALNGVAKSTLEQATLIQAVDGDILPDGMFQYGRDYNLGDIVEIQGSDEAISAIRVTEHIISEEATGEKGYVTYGSDSADVSL